MRRARTASRRGNAHLLRGSRSAIGHAQVGAFVAHLVHLDATEFVQLVHPEHVSITHMPKVAVTPSALNARANL